MPIGADPSSVKHRHQIPVPEGLRSLLESLAREVLRGQPSDIYSFSALFFEKLNEFRSNTGVNPIDSPELYDKFKLELFTEASNKQLVNSKSLLLSSTKGLNLDDSRTKSARQDAPNLKHKIEQKTIDPNLAATKIQASARGFLARRRVAHNKDALIAERDKRAIEDDAYSPKRPTRKRAKKRPKTALSNDQDSPLVVTTTAAEQTDKVVGGTKDVDQAATKIQAGIRGYLTRKKYVEIKHKREHAATKIQAGIKGHLTRKHLQAKGIPVHRVSRSPSPNPNAQAVQPLAHEDVHGKQTEVAAAKIQAGVRGYLTRKHMEEKGLHVVHPKKSGSKSSSPGRMMNNPFENEIPAESHVVETTTTTTTTTTHVEGNPNEAEAASKIQAGIRGYLTRKHLNEKGIPVHAPAHHRHDHERKSKSPSPNESSQVRTPHVSKIPMRRGQQKTKQGSPGLDS